MSEVSPPEAGGPEVRDGTYPASGALVGARSIERSASSGPAEAVEPLDVAEPAGPVDFVESVESVDQPAKVLRIGSMIKQLLDEVRQAPLDSASRVRMKDIYETSVRELASGLSSDLAAELDRLALPFESSVPSDAELRVAQAQLVGWLEGLFHGIQAALFAQQMAARSQLEEMRQQPLSPGGPRSGPPALPGSYL